MADLFGSTHAWAIMVRHRLADLAIRENASRDIILELDHHPKGILPAWPGQGILWSLQAVDQWIEQPRVNQRTQHITFLQVFPRPGHGRLLPIPESCDRAVYHNRDVHRHPLTGLLKGRYIRGLEDARRADPS